MRLQEAVKKETAFISAGSLILTALMLLLFFLLDRFTPLSVPFVPKVLISGILGCLVAVFNFFWMALTVQKVASTEDEGKARSIMTVSYRNRMLLQLIWVVLAFALPVFNGAAGLIPLFFPSILIKCRGILSLRKGQVSVNKGSE